MSVSTQTELDPTNTCEVSIQCNIKHIQCNIKQPKIHIFEQLETESDKETMEEMDYSISSWNKAEYSSNNKSTGVSSLLKVAFTVYWSSLMVLLNKCLTCCLLASVTNISLKGSQLIVQLIWSDKHKTTAVAVLFSANIFQKISKYFEITNIMDYKNKLLLNSRQIFSLCCQLKLLKDECFLHSQTDAARVV